MPENKSFDPSKVPASGRARDDRYTDTSGLHAQSPERQSDSELLYRRLFESTGDAIMLLSASGFLECNDAALQLFGCQSRADFISKHPSEVSPHFQPDGVDSLTSANRHIASAMEVGTDRFEWLHQREDGTPFMADVLLARVDLTSGPILQAVVRDITRRKQIEQELLDAHEQLEQRVQERTAELAAANQELKQEVIERRKAEQDLALERFLLKTLMDQAPDFIFFKDRNSRNIRVSRALAEFYGLNDPDEAIGKTDVDFFDATYAARYMQDEREVLETGCPIIGKEEDQPSADGAVQWVLTNKIPLFNPDGEIMGTFGISRDITRQKETEARLQVAMEEAKAASRAKSDFLANMSHEIRTPMNAIIGMTELVLDTPLTSSQREYLKMVLGSSESLLTVINDILDFSKVEAGKLNLEAKTFDVRELFGDTVKSLALRAHDKGIELVCQVHPSVPNWLISDAARLRQVVVNLIGNAIKFTEEGEVVLSADCSHVRGHSVRLACCVKDTGVGIELPKQQSIFRAFEQADNSTTRRFGGTGLGLTICSRLVHAMGGSISVESTPGQGSEFQFTVSLTQSTTAPLTAYQRVGGAVDGTRVLVVDDNATNLHMLKETLLNWRMRPTLALSVAGAVEQLQTAAADAHPFDLILTDANMPDQDGFELARQVAEDPRLKRTVIMMLTSGGHPGDVARCEALRIASYLIKPVKQSELFDAIVAALGIDSIADQPAPSSQRQELPSLRPLRILLAEDSLVNQKLAVGLLKKQGHQVDVVEDGRLAVAAVHRQEYDLVLMDVQMPEMDGLEATQCIRKDEATSGAHIPIVAMTAHAMKGDRERCLAAGMDEYVSKPIRAKDVFAAVDKVLHGPHFPQDV